MTSKQNLQKNRAWFKFVISGLPRPIDMNSLTDWEKETWNQIKALSKLLIDEFDNNSKELGLKVPEHKCWCGREGKYNSTINGEYVCKKHLEF